MLTKQLSAVTKVYPPKTNADLRALFNHIVPSELDIHHKQSLIYYILKDCRAAPEASSQFSQQCHLPEKYRLFIEGLWHLDRLDFRVSCQRLVC
jgi:superoxide dismutase